MYVEALSQMIMAGGAVLGAGAGMAVPWAFARYLRQRRDIQQIRQRIAEMQGREPQLAIIRSASAGMLPAGRPVHVGAGLAHAA